MTIQPEYTPAQQAVDDAIREWMNDRPDLFAIPSEVPVSQPNRGMIGEPRSARETPASAATDRGRGPTSKESSKMDRTPTRDRPARDA